MHYRWIRNHSKLSLPNLTQIQILTRRQTCRFDTVFYCCCSRQEACIGFFLMHNEGRAGFLVIVTIGLCKTILILPLGETISVFIRNKDESVPRDSRSSDFPIRALSVTNFFKFYSAVFKNFSEAQRKLTCMALGAWGMGLFTLFVNRSRQTICHCWNLTSNHIINCKNILRRKNFFL